MSDVDDHGGSTTATTEDPRNGFASMAPVIIGITSAVATVAALFSWDAVERGRFEDECDKGNAAALLGYRVLHFTPAHVEDGRALAVIQQALGIEQVA